MGIPYDIFTGAFLSKVTEYDFPLDNYERDELVDGYMKKSWSGFKSVCKYDITPAFNDAERTLDIDIADGDIDEIVDIVSEGMLVQWMKPYVYRQENLSNVLNTRDFSTYSPAELLHRIMDAYAMAKKDYQNMVLKYSYDHANLTELHL